MRISTPDYLVYGGLVTVTFIVNMKYRMLSFWNRLVWSNKLLSKVCTLLVRLKEDGFEGIKCIAFLLRTQLTKSVLV